MEEVKEGQEASLDRCVELFEKLVNEWNKLVKMQKENLEVFDRIKRGQI